MRINISIDIEDEVRRALSSYMTEKVYCLPLPKNFSVPCVLVEVDGGDDEENAVDTFTVTLTSRAELEEGSFELIRRAVGILYAVAKKGNTPIRYVKINTLYTWGEDMDRPELAISRATLFITAHKSNLEV